MKKKQVNFSKAEINFLNNFSSVAELQSFAVNFSDTLDKVNNYILENRWVVPVAGMVGGAGIGAGGGILLGDPNKSKRERALIGAGIGASIGGLGGLLAALQKENLQDKIVDAQFKLAEKQLKRYQKLIGVDPGDLKAEEAEFVRRYNETQGMLDSASDRISSEFEQTTQKINDVNKRHGW